jgi:hypothetical protein
VEKVVAPPTYPKDIEKHKLVNAKWILLDSVKDHLIPHIARKNTAKDMYDALGDLYHSANVSRKILLKNKLTSTRIAKQIQ